MSKFVLTMSPSSLDKLQECFRAWKLDKLMGLRRISTRANRALSLGEMFHLMLEEYYQQKIQGKPFDRNAIFQAAIKAFNVEDSKEFEVLINIFDEYRAFYQYESWRPVAVEKPFSTALYEDEEYLILLEGKLDLVILNEHDQTQIVDHKTKSSNYYSAMPPNQFYAYALATGHKIITVNQIRLDTTKDRFSRPIFSFSDEQLQEWKNNAIRWCLLAAKALQSNEDLYSQTHCFKCQFAEHICSSPESAREFKLMAYFEKVTRNDMFKKDK